jgi:hypothetical protein
MEIKLSLNTKSIDKAIKKLEREKKRLENVMISEFLEECGLWFINRANLHLSQSDIGKEIVYDIQSNWTLPTVVKSGNTYTMVVENYSDKAVFVEFGVGLVGSQIPHPQASKENYIYDKNGYGNSTANGYWVYYLDDLEEVDMHKGYQYKDSKYGGYWIITKGSWRDMYAYNTLMDMTTEGKVLKGLWTKVKQKYWS